MGVVFLIWKALVTYFQEKYFQVPWLRLHAEDFLSDSSNVGSLPDGRKWPPTVMEYG